MEPPRPQSTFPDEPTGHYSGAGFCPQTQWTLLLDPIRKRAPGFDVALNELVAIYRPVIVNFVRTRTPDWDSAEDVAHDFLAQILAGDALAQLDRSKGRFRSFLFASLRNFMANQYRSQRTAKRGGGNHMVSIEGKEFEALEPVAASEMASDFDRQWAWTLMERGIRLVEAQYRARGAGDRFDDLKGFLPGGQSVLTRVQIGTRWGVSPGAVDKGVHDLRVRVKAEMRRLVRDTVERPEDVDAELEFLASALGT